MRLVKAIYKQTVVMQSAPAWEKIPLFRINSVFLMTNVAINNMKFQIRSKELSRLSSYFTSKRSKAKDYTWYMHMQSYECRFIYFWSMFM